MPSSVEVENGTRSHAAQGFDKKFDWVQVVLLWLNLFLLRSCDSNTVYGRVVGVVLESKKKKKRGAWD
jgi:hypothetical protein